MEWLLSNWIWIVLGIGFIAFHMFGHGGHRHGRSGSGERDPVRANDATDATESGHIHPDASVPEAAGTKDPELRGAVDDAGRAASPTPADGSRHKHGC